MNNLSFVSERVFLQMWACTSKGGNVGVSTDMDRARERVTYFQNYWVLGPTWVLGSD